MADAKGDQSITDPGESHGPEPATGAVNGTLDAPEDSLAPPEAPRLSLQGRRIGVTRADQQLGAARSLFEAAGATVVDLPALAVTPPDDWGPLDDALAELERYTLGYVDSYLHDGREMLREARRRRQRLQEERRRLAI